MPRTALLLLVFSLMNMPIGYASGAASGGASFHRLEPLRSNLTHHQPGAVTEELQIRVQGDPRGTCLVYIPGIHGDWTLVQGFKKELGSNVCFIELTYPRTLSWTLDDYAVAILDALEGAGVEKAWLIGESFGSQLVWQILSHDDRSLKVEGVVLAGGFVKYPAPRMLRAARWFFSRPTPKALERISGGFRAYARFRFRHNPDARADLEEFLARRTMLDIQAIAHRMDLIATNDPRGIARDARMPVYSITGLLDPIVPSMPVTAWLQRNCPGYVDHKLIFAADHNVLATAPKASARQILSWMKSK